MMMRRIISLFAASNDQIGLSYQPARNLLGIANGRIDTLDLVATSRRHGIPPGDVTVTP